jgi:soluble lytic murein transglycosylase-like protein
MRSVVLLLTLLSACLARADIYGYTDAEGVLHLSDFKVDERYSVVFEDPRPPQPPAVTVAPQEVLATPAAGAPGNYRPIIEATAQRFGLPPALLHAVISAESAYNPSAISRKGALGLMQLMPETAKRYGVADRRDPTENVRGGAHYLSDLLRLFNNDLRLAVAAYNAGEAAVLRYGRVVPPYSETRTYVERVLGLYSRLR